ncbi:MAG: ComEC/Rec2 family competence protein [bacterium]|nr:ComEC/Rec2 family competence protein [bacterium]
MQKIRGNTKYFFLLILAAGVALVWYAVISENRSGLMVAFLDVGQGDAIFIQAPNGNQILVDAGPPNKKVLKELSKVMPFYDRSIDVVIESHPDADHIGGVPEVLRRYDVFLVMEPGVNSDSAVYSEAEKLIKEKNVKKVLARKGMKIDLGENIFLLVLFPDRDASGLDTNYASVILKLVYGETSFLLTGDSPKEIESYLTEIYKEGLASEVLKAGHHGSDTSTSELFLGYTAPQYAVISVGKDNKYGHPRKEVLDRLEKFGVNILRTDEQGTIIFTSDGREVSVK